MRQREITWQGWRVSWPDVDGGRHEFTADDRDEADLEAEILRSQCVDGVRVRPVTRYRLAPLVEVKAWRKGSDFCRCGAESLADGHTATVRRHDSALWGWWVAIGETQVTGFDKSKRAAMAAAEAHLAVLGFRVKKEKRR